MCEQTPAQPRPLAAAGLFTVNTVTASHAATVTLVSPVELVAAQADATGRTVEGIVVPYGPVGYTNVGPIRVRAGALPLPRTADELARVKLVDEHQNPPRPIGYAVAAEDRPEGRWMRFRLGTTALAENALTEALERLRDAFSVELASVTYTADGEVTAAALPSVALVTVPAFDTARVSQVAASRVSAAATTERNTMTDEQRARLAELRALETLTQEQAAELAELATAEHHADEAATAETPAPAAPAAAPAPAVAASRHATVPSGIPGARSVQAHGLPDLYAAQARVLTGQSRPEVEAALSNITGTANIWTSPDAYAGELWSGLSFSDPYESMMGSDELTSYKVRGWRWVVRPEVDDYVGDKAPVPSNAPTTEEVIATAARLAGAHDFDRKYVDFGDTEFLASYYRAMTESTAVKLSRKRRAALIAAGNANVSATVLSAAAGDTILDAALVAKLELETYEDDDFAAGTPDFYLVNSTDYRALFRTKATDVRAYAESLGVTPDKFRATTQVPAGAVIAGVRAANTFYTMKGQPIRVETINVTNGGVDGGVFAYWAAINHHAKGTVRVNVAA